VQDSTLTRLFLPIPVQAEGPERSCVRAWIPSGIFLGKQSTIQRSDPSINPNIITGCLPCPNSDSAQALRLFSTRPGWRLGEAEKGRKKLAQERDNDSCVRAHSRSQLASSLVGRPERRWRKPVPCTSVLR